MEPSVAGREVNLNSIGERGSLNLIAHLREDERVHATHPAQSKVGKCFLFRGLSPDQCFSDTKVLLEKLCRWADGHSKNNKAFFCPREIFHAPSFFFKLWTILYFSNGLLFLMVIRILHGVCVSADDIFLASTRDLASVGSRLAEGSSKNLQFCWRLLRQATRWRETSKTTGQQLFYCSLIFQVERESRLCLVYLGASRKKLLHGKGTWGGKNTT